ncbi:MAG TPA: thioesterase family protein [Holophagaceae bacterium]|nr:thioesterase family protein [Holophagaceae bacterium]
MPFIHDLEVRFRDLDALGHVNNAVVLSYLEQARFHWWKQHLAGRGFQEEGFLLARMEVDYRRPILMEDRVRVELHCTRIGNSSFDLAYRVIKAQDGALLAEARSVQVMLDFAAERPMPLRPETRRWLESQQ